MKAFFGEILGTFIMVFVGCGAIAVSVLFNWLDLLGVALVFGGGVALGIFASRNWSGAHLNPAVSMAFVLIKELPVKRLLPYITAQFVGAFLAGLSLLLIFDDSIAFYEGTNEIIRGEASSRQSAMMFGEFYPNPQYHELGSVSTIEAMLVEALGTFVLVLVIFQLLISKFHRNLVPILIGLTITSLIVLFAPYTQGGFNPARDFAPRIVAYVGGWGDAAFPPQNFGFLIVYVLGPILGAVMAVVGLRIFRISKNTIN